MAFFDFLFTINPLAALSIVTLVITIAVTLITKFTTDQKRMKELRDEQKKYQEEMKKTRDEPDKMMKIQKKAMTSNLEYMKHSFRSTLYTFLPMILVFSWLNTSFAYYNIMPGESFNVSAHFTTGTLGNVTLDPTPQMILESPGTQNVNDTVTWHLHASAGEHLATLTYRDETYQQKILVSTERTYLPPVQNVDHSKLTKITTDLQQVQPLDPVNLFGWHPGWFATYIFLSILFTTILRKVLKVY